MNYNQQRVGKNIRCLRKSLRMNINQLANAVCITPSFLGLVERGERGLRIENLCKLSSVFGVSLDDLVYADFSGDTKKNTAKEGDDGFARQIDSYMRAAGKDELALAITILREIRDYTKNLTNKKAEESGGEIPY